MMGVVGSTHIQADQAVAEALRRLIDFAGAKPPAIMNSPDTLALRRRFLNETLGAEGEVAYERVIAGNELQPVAYLERGAIAARAVAKVAIKTTGGAAAGSGTGFLIAPGVLITNNHVIDDKSLAINSLAQFAYETDLAGRPVGPIDFALDPNTLFHTNEPLDFTIVAVRPLALDGKTTLDAFGSLPLLGTTGKASEGEWLSLIQHPDGQRKQVCIRENKLIKRQPDVLWYSTDTKPGSSGSPVFNNDWFVVALHHAGVPEMRNGIPQTIDGRDFNPSTMTDDLIKWVGNEGIRASRIHQTLQAALPSHPLLQPLFAATPTSARVDSAPQTSKPMSRPALFAAQPRSTAITPPDASDIMTTNDTVTIPIEIKLMVRPNGTLAAPAVTGAAESTAFLEARKKKEAMFDAPFEPDYSKRKGYDAKFLGAGGKIVSLPRLGPLNELVAAPLLNPTASNKFVLHYDNYSLVMHKDRRLAIYSAANVSFGKRFEMARSRDVWRRDPRIRPEHQLEGWYYVKNQFDRGHLTRREDLEFGISPQKALMSAGDTCHWTNCAPQHAKFNQNKEIWQGIERYILEESIYNGEVDAQIFTGPVLDEGDPEYQKIKYPLQFWKVVAALKSDGSLFATAYIASQEEVIAQYGIETTEAPFGAYGTFQTTIAEIERLTGLTFVSGEGGAKPLKDYDPLEAPARRQRNRRFSPRESTRGHTLPPNYFPITDLGDIQV
jgi:endonuclease G